ncbi:ThuA domain-containing protein [Paenibacillus shunpengii]|uniref:ThuA domain-containing protein n=1 Tax=Paenibacillus shunpengii TaxID=2054424 RepID=A0ABW5SQ32_9BACL|nr:ThuA domain-containing protein [Paenibacillus sp. PDC88]SDX19922.1 Type 1 glutamine amidotransferase (GATase1) [Paenibacillus sp. PDC88]
MKKDSLTGKHIVFIAGEDEYMSEITLPQVAKEISDGHGARVTVLTASPEPKESANLPGLEKLASVDLIVLYLRFRELPEEQFRPLLAYVQSGKPILGFRTSTHSFRYPEGHPLEEWNSRFGIEVLGAPWIRHYGHSSSTDVSICRGAEHHPIVEGLPSSFHVRSWLYHVLPYPPEGAQLLLNGHTVDPELKEQTINAPRIQPVAWTRRNAWGGNVFMTTLGHPEEFTMPEFRRLINNAIHWLLKEDEGR